MCLLYHPARQLVRLVRLRSAPFSLHTTPQISWGWYKSQVRWLLHPSPPSFPQRPQACVSHLFAMSPFIAQGDVQYGYELVSTALIAMPHLTVIATCISTAYPEAILFVRLPVVGRPPVLGRGAYQPLLRWFNADTLGLLRGKCSSTLQAIKIGSTAICKSLLKQLGRLKGDALTLGAFPSKRVYCSDSRGHGVGDYSSQEEALGASLNAADGLNALYCPTRRTHGGAAVGTAGGMPNESEAALMTKDTAQRDLHHHDRRELDPDPRLGAGWRANPYDFLID
ncbi:hypothetical protein K438DRAFT_1940221, partial [Mycena galopus ATCC 62051]